MEITDLRKTIKRLEKSGVYSLAIPYYECLMHNGDMTESEYKRLHELYSIYNNVGGMNRVAARYKQIYR